MTIRLYLDEDTSDSDLLEALRLRGLDKHLLDLGKPYGVSCLTPRAFLSEVLKHE